ncbi:transmembrane amino acid transporter protein (macronuclear) [Tetrahymena thermophila SB210]|uniref:Transmembrane amino acid transporter protein n=1 Tax=Tetrahymena thermophila (strain SB210) TaxID=312017 RepID=Q239R3_TETTS|nr:transmembrane amino acid transporter protein [Tetrahymena thermophila SB210]EAR93252.1 transmembrane amino acid transporter protein [Tetrahymena thermophila SB210]|eukprot:XP_001013497.1 transmembrane amino acid transporter protein [Tetrahymena thermophila SB210]
MSSPQLEQQQSLPAVGQSPEQQTSGNCIINDTPSTEEKQLSQKTNYSVQDSLDQPKGTVLSATASILKGGIGTGILFLPSTFQACGIGLSIIFMIICAVVSYFCWSLISKIIRFQESTDTKDPTNRNLTLEATGGKLYGKSFLIFLQACTYIYAYSSCFAYSIFIYQTLNPIIPNNMVIMAIMFAFYLPLSMYKNIDKLSLFTYLGLSATIITLIIIIGKSCEVIDTTNVNFSSLTQFDFTQIPLQFGVFSFAYDVNGMYTEVHASMKNKNQFDSVLRYYLCIFTLLGIFVGMMGYIAFGADTQAVIFQNIGSMGGVGTALDFLYSFSILASILLYVFTVVKFLDSMIQKYMLKNSTKCMNLFQKVALRSVIFFSFTFLAQYVNQISNVFNILGCIFCTILTYICPLIFYVKAVKKQKSILNAIQNGDIEKDTIQVKPPNISVLDTHYKYYILSGLSFIFGLLGGTSGLVSTIIQIQQSS